MIVNVVNEESLELALAGLKLVIIGAPSLMASVLAALVPRVPVTVTLAVPLVAICAAETVVCSSLLLT